MFHTKSIANRLRDLRDTLVCLHEDESLTPSTIDLAFNKTINDILNDLRIPSGEQSEFDPFMLVLKCLEPVLSDARINAYSDTMIDEIESNGLWNSFGKPGRQWGPTIRIKEDEFIKRWPEDAEKSYDHNFYGEDADSARIHKDFGNIRVFAMLTKRRIVNEVENE